MSWVHLGAGDRAGDPEGMLSPEWPDERAAAELGQHPKAVIFFSFTVNIFCFLLKKSLLDPRSLKCFLMFLCRNLKYLMCCFHI